MLEQGSLKTLPVILERGTRVTVVPSNAEGKPLAGAVVAGRIAGGALVPPSLLVLGRKGEGLNLGPLPPGRWEFTVYHPSIGKYTAVRDIPAGKSATLVLAPGN